jgi:hypothetical protein
MECYKGVRVEIQPERQGNGGWIAEFRLIEAQGSNTIVTPYPIKVAFSSEERAKQEALAAAYRTIEEKRRVARA